MSARHILAACLAIGLVAGCGSPSPGPSAGSPTTTTAAPDGVPITVTAFTASGQRISVDFQIDAGSATVRFAWDRFVATSPSGDTYTAYRSADSLPEDLIKGTYVSGATFEVGEIERGEWSVAYDGVVLATETF